MVKTTPWKKLSFLICPQKVGSLNIHSLIISLEKENALNEVRILASINNPHVVSYKEAFYDDSTSSLCIVMDFASGGDLLQKIE